MLTGGELTLEQLDLQYDTHTKMYQAPFQLKANGGVLILDDFGRQRVPPKDLLNRWIVPLEKRIDFLTLHTGGKFPVPFDCLLIIATNLEPSQLVEEAFLRRIHYKILIEGPTRSSTPRSSRAAAIERGIDVRSGGGEPHLRRLLRPAAASTPAPATRATSWTTWSTSLVSTKARPELTDDMVDRACRSYFLDDSRKE